MHLFHEVLGQLHQVVELHKDRITNCQCLCNPSRAAHMPRYRQRIPCILTCAGSSLPHLPRTHTHALVSGAFCRKTKTPRNTENQCVMQKGMDSKPVTKGTIPVCHQGTTHRERVCGCAHMLEAPERGLAPCSSVPFAECAPCLRELFRPLPRAGVRVYKCIRADHAQRQCSSFHELRTTCRDARDCCVFG